MNKEFSENEALWNLLGNASRPLVSPFFARNVMRSVRNLSRETIIPPFLLPWVGAAALILIILGFSLSLPVSSPSKIPVELVEYFDIAAGLDQLAVVEDAGPSIFAPARL